MMLAETVIFAEKTLQFYCQEARKSSLLDVRWEWQARFNEHTGKRVFESLLSGNTAPLRWTSARLSTTVQFWVF